MPESSAGLFRHQDVIAGLKVSAHNADDADDTKADPCWLTDQVIEFYLDRIFTPFRCTGFRTLIRMISVIVIPHTDFVAVHHGNFHTRIAWVFDAGKRKRPQVFANSVREPQNIGRS